MSGNYSPRAGMFTETIVFRSPVIVNDEITGYSDAFTVKAHVQFVGGREYPEAGRDVTEADVMFRIYRRKDLSFSMRIKHAGLEYDVRRMEPSQLGPRALAMDIWGRLIR